MKYIVIEDEELASIRLSGIVSRLRPNYKLCGCLKSVKESVDFLKDNDVDLIFMDIELGDGTCFDILKSADTDAFIIFTTAYGDYVMEAFKTQGVDYILKPFEEKDVEKAIDKLEKIHTIFQRKHNDKISGPEQKAKRILICGNKTYEFCHLSRIAFFCFEARYISAYTYDGKIYLTEFKNMDDVLTLTFNEDFRQLSRAVIAHIDAVSQVIKIDNGRLRVKLSAGNNSKEVIISQVRKNEFLHWLGE